MDTPAPQIEKKPKVTLLPIEASKKLAPADVSSIAQQLVANVEKVIIGKHEPVVLATAVWLAEGHLLIEDVPGVAKTMLARALAQSAGCTFKRIQCTPDLQPSEPDDGEIDRRVRAAFEELKDQHNRDSPTQATTESSEPGAASSSAPHWLAATMRTAAAQSSYSLRPAQKRHKHNLI